MAADIDHARIVEALANSHERRMLGVLQQLEERVAAYAITAPTQDGRLFDLAWSVQARNDIQGIMREIYLTEADSIVREYDQVVESIGTMFEEYESFVGVSPEVVSNLQRVSFQGFQDVAATFSNELADELYQNSLVGRPVAESVKNLRQKINGVYIQSDQAEIQRLVNIANAGGEGSEEAVRELHQTYAADRTGNNMRRYARQMVHDSIMQFDAGINTAAGKEVGATLWKYYGSVIQDSRPHCVKYAGKLFTEDEIREIWTETNWAGKADGDPFIVRGGYNCRHHWRPVFDIEDDSTDPRISDEPTVPQQKLEFPSVRFRKVTQKGYDRGEEKASTYISLVDSEGGIRNEATFLMNKYQPKNIFSVKNGGTYYGNTKTIENDPKDRQTFIHEYGHNIDYELNNGRALSPTLQKFKDAALEDARELRVAPWWEGSGQSAGDYYSARTGKFREFQGVFYDKKQEIIKRGRYKGLTQTVSVPKKQNYRGVMDIIDSMSEGEAWSGGFMHGHGKKYYARAGAKEKENFANLFAAWANGGETWEETQRFFPRLTKVFEGIMGDAISGRIG